MLTFVRSVHVLVRILCILYVFTSCSLDYASTDDAKSSSPEFIFYNANFTRTEENKQTMHMMATQLEQYSGLDAMYLKNASFTLYDSDLQPSITGSCELLSADMDKDIYHFLGSVHIMSYEHDVEVTAQDLRWNNKTEILSSGFSDNVRIVAGSGKTLITTDNADTNDNETQTRIFIEGTGFSAKGIDLSYSFDGKITGNIIETTTGTIEEENTIGVADEN